MTRRATYSNNLKLKPAGMTKEEIMNNSTRVNHYERIIKEFDEIVKETGETGMLVDTEELTNSQRSNVAYSLNKAIKDLKRTDLVCYRSQSKVFLIGEQDKQDEEN